VRGEEGATAERAELVLRTAGPAVPPYLS